MHPTLLLAILPAFASPTAAAQEPDVRARFVELADKGDRDGIVALWKAHPGDVLGVKATSKSGSAIVGGTYTGANVGPITAEVTALNGADAINGLTEVIDKHTMVLNEKFVDVI